MSKQIRVIKIIDDYRIVINSGHEDGVKKGDNFDIYVPGEEVIDPVTNESLGTLDFIKATVVATQIFPKMSICENADVQTYSLIPNLSEAFTRKERKPLNVETTHITGGLSIEDRKIKVGDLVRKSLG